jgi:hypothetical protein
MSAKISAQQSPVQSQPSATVVTGLEHPRFQLCGQDDYTNTTCNPPNFDFYNFPSPPAPGIGRGVPMAMLLPSNLTLPKGESSCYLC